MNMKSCNIPPNPSLQRDAAKPVRFHFEAPDAKSIYLVGDFNNWDPTANPMRRQADGCWLVQVPLSRGHHEYQFLVDGEPTLDPHARGVGQSEWNNQVSLISVL